MSEQYNQKWREAILGLTKTDLADMVERICRERDGLYIRAKNAEAALEEAKAYMAIYANEDNWASHDGVMYLRTLSTPWGNAKEFLRRHGGPK